MPHNLVKSISTLILCCLFFSSFSQKRVKERDIIGTWKLEIQIEEAFDEAVADTESVLGRVIIESVSGLVEGILDNIDIYFEFQPDHDVKVIVEAFDETDIEYSSWRINSKGELIIEEFDDSDRFNIQVEDVWLMEDDVLVAYEYQRGERVREEAVLVRID